MIQEDNTQLSETAAYTDSLTFLLGPVLPFTVSAHAVPKTNAVTNPPPACARHMPAHQAKQTIDLRSGDVLL